MAFLRGEKRRESSYIALVVWSNKRNMAVRRKSYLKGSELNVKIKSTHQFELQKIIIQDNSEPHKHA